MRLSCIDRRLYSIGLCFDLPLEHLGKELGEDVNRALNEQRWALVISSSAGSQQNVERLRGAFDQLRAGAKLWCVSFYVASRFLGR